MGRNLLLRKRLKETIVDSFQVLEVLTTLRYPITIKKEDIMEKDTPIKRGTSIEDELLNPDREAGSDWFTKLATVERAKAVRRETQKARKGKPITLPGNGGWAR